MGRATEAMERNQRLGMRKTTSEKDNGKSKNNWIKMEAEWMQRVNSDNDFWHRAHNPDNGREECQLMNRITKDGVTN